MIKKILLCLYRAAVKTVDDDGVEHAGYMSFMELLSIFPFLVFFLAMTSFFGASEIGENFIQIMMDNLPDTALDSIRDRVTELSKTPPQSLLTLAIIGSIWTASSFVECMRTILNRVNQITSPPNYIFRRLLSIVQFLLMTLVITSMIFILILLPVALSKIPGIGEIVVEYLKVLNTTRYAIILIVLFFGTATLYYVIPNAKLSFKEVLPGAFLTVTLWMISGSLFSKYIVYYNQLSIVYGSLGSIIITLLFFYIINMLFIYGAEFNFLLKQEIYENR